MEFQSRTLDDYVASFEKSRRTGEVVNLEDYLPASEDPLYHSVLCELIRIDLEFGWASGQARPLDDYLRQFPQLLRNPDSLQGIALEEYRLRREAGLDPSPQEYAQRYGVSTKGWPGTEAAESSAISFRLAEAAFSYRAWQGQVPDEEAGFSGAELLLHPSLLERSGGGEAARLFRDLHRSDRPVAQHLAQGLLDLVQVGGEFGGFRLLQEVGRGAFGRVFLATQESLADRPVALKIAPDVGGESHALAQLQHTHIVPIYSTHKVGSLQAVCMPWCGRCTLATVWRDLQLRQDRPRNGLDLLRVLPRRKEVASGSEPVASGEWRVAREEPKSRRAEDAAHPSGLATRHSPLTTLREMSHPEAVLWLGAGLADALEHAHQRGILHRDIKPANILLTDEGLPMLLDFNVAEDIKQRASSAALLGGTLPYMAPEHLRDFLGHPDCSSPLNVDARSDVYSLGVVLFQLMTGRFPFPAVGASDERNPGPMEELLERMLETRCGPPPDPRRLNPTVTPAASAIVRHCLEPDPARRYQSAAQLREDLERQLAHRPLAWAPDRSLPERARKWRRRHPRLELYLSLAGCVLLLGLALLLTWRVGEHIRREEARTNWLLFQSDFRQARLQLETPPDPNSPRRAETLCRQALDRYGVFEAPDWRRHWRVTALPSADQERLRWEVGELLHQMAGRVLRGKPASDEVEQALGWNELARQSLDPAVPAQLWSQRADLLERLGRTEEARAARQQAREHKADPVREGYLLALEKKRKGELREARELFRSVVRARNDHYWAWFNLGLCCDGLGDDQGAALAYSVCVSQEPDFFAAWLNRGLAWCRKKDYAAALADLDKAIEQEPGRADSYLDRALARQGLGDAPGALADLTCALERGTRLTRLYFLRARVRRSLGDLTGAALDENEGMNREPTEASSYVSRGMFRLKKDPWGALADFERALQLEPRYLPALRNKAHVLSEYFGKTRQASAILAHLLQLSPEQEECLAGQGVLLARLGKRPEALRHARAALQRSSAPMIRYQAACIHALTSRQEPGDRLPALVLLRQALRGRFGLELIETDEDLAPLRGSPEFQLMLTIAALYRPPTFSPRVGSQWSEPTGWNHEPLPTIRPPAERIAPGLRAARASGPFRDPGATQPDGDRGT
jgi:serine/threonine protein kinase/Tfp pilus assembly protein PilF